MWCFCTLTREILNTCSCTKGRVHVFYKKKLEKNRKEDPVGCIFCFIGFLFLYMVFNLLEYILGFKTFFLNNW